MATRIVMPQAGQDLDTGTVTQWLKAEGDAVTKGEALVAVETEKISLELEAPASGVLLKIVVPDKTQTADPLDDRHHRRAGRGHLRESNRRGYPSYVSTSYDVKPWST